MKKRRIIREARERTILRQPLLRLAQLLHALEGMVCKILIQVRPQLLARKASCNQTSATGSTTEKYQVHLQESRSEDTEDREAP